MKKISLSLILALVILLSSMTIVSAIPYECGGCDATASYRLMRFVDDYFLLGYVPCWHDDHLDAEYSIFGYDVYKCDECGHELANTRDYYTYIDTFCPGEPLPEINGDGLFGR